MAGSRQSLLNLISSNLITVGVSVPYGVENGLNLNPANTNCSKSGPQEGLSLPAARIRPILIQSKQRLSRSYHCCSKQEKLLPLQANETVCHPLGSSFADSLNLHQKAHLQLLLLRGRAFGAVAAKASTTESYRSKHTSCNRNKTMRKQILVFLLSMLLLASAVSARRYRSRRSLMPDPRAVEVRVKVGSCCCLS